MKARLPDEYQSNKAAMMRRLQAAQEQIAQVQEEVEKSEFSASVGGGAVAAVCNGKHELLSIKIKPEVLDPEDPEMLEDLVLAAVNEVLSKAEETMTQRMEEAQGGLSLPGMPF
jgi:DNA-binding YbaB/EbfC family protein